MSDRMFKRLLIGIAAIVVICICVIAIYSITSVNNKNNNQAQSSQNEDPRKKVDVKSIQTLSHNNIWSKSAFIGSENAEHKLVIYGDLFCPYCRKAFEAIQQNIDDFKAKYIDTGKLSYEYRVTDLLTNSGDADETYISSTGGEVVQCAAKQNHFWDYYQAIEDKIYDDYYKNGLGDRHYDRATEPDWRKHQIPRLETSYFTDVAAKVEGIDMTKMNNCISSNDGMKQLQQYSLSANKAGANSFPSFFLDGKIEKGLYAIDNTYDYSKFYKGIVNGLAAKGIM